MEFISGGADIRARTQQRELAVPYGLVRRVLPRLGGGAYVELRTDLIWDSATFVLGRIAGF